MCGNYDYFQRSSKYFTIIREPIQRNITLYNYLRSNNLYKQIENEDMNLETFTKSGLALAADNDITRLIGGYDLDKVPQGRITMEIARKAKAIGLEKFCFVGLTEQFDLSLLSLSKILNWKNSPYYSKINVTQHKYYESSTIKSRELDFLKSYLAPDIYLYNEMVKHFNTQIELLFQGEKDKVLVQFHQENLIYSPKNKLLHDLQKFLRIAKFNLENIL
jgi:hypothetical protein